MHNEKVIIASSLAKVECVVLLALGNTAMEFHEAGEQGNGVHSTLHNYLNVVIKSSFSFFPLLPDGQRSNLIFWGADQTFLQSINHKFGLIFFLFFFIDSCNRCANNSFSLNSINLGYIVSHIGRQTFQRTSESHII